MIKKITKEAIEHMFKYVRTWDVTKYTPEGTVDEYELRTKDFSARLMFYKADSRWCVEILNFHWPYKKYTNDSIEDVQELMDVLKLFDKSIATQFELQNINI